jgi:hypothetical protein
MDAWVGVVGTLLGTIVGAGATFFIERWRANRDDRFRFAPDKRVLYARLIAEARAYLRKVAYGRKRGIMARRLLASGGIEEMTLGEVPQLFEFTAAREEVSWLAPAGVVDAMDQLYGALANLGEGWGGADSFLDDALPDESQWNLDRALVDAAIERLKVAIRRDLGLSEDAPALGTRH